MVASVFPLRGPAPGPSAFQAQGAHPQWAPKPRDLASVLLFCPLVRVPSTCPSCAPSTFQMRHRLPCSGTSQATHRLLPEPSSVLPFLRSSFFTHPPPRHVPCGRAGMQPGMGRPAFPLCTWIPTFAGKAGDPRSCIRASLPCKPEAPWKCEGCPSLPSFRLPARAELRPSHPSPAGQSRE